MSDLDLDRPYDPDPLAVGDRVRVRLSGECQIPHFGFERGARGAVAEPPFCKHGAPFGHTVYVRLDRRREALPMPFARAELERLTGEDA